MWAKKKWTAVFYYVCVERRSTWLHGELITADITSVSAAVCSSPFHNVVVRLVFAQKGAERASNRYICTVWSPSVTNQRLRPAVTAPRLLCCPGRLHLHLITARPLIWLASHQRLLVYVSPSAALWVTDGGDESSFSFCPLILPLIVILCSLLCHLITAKFAFFFLSFFLSLWASSLMSVSGWLVWCHTL